MEQENDFREFIVNNYQMKPERKETTTNAEDTVLEMAY